MSGPVPIGARAKARARAGSCWLALLMALALTPAYAGLRVNVDIAGLGDRLRTNVLALLAIEQQKDDPRLTEARLRRLQAQAPQQIRSALAPFGYYHPVIHSQLLQNDGVWTARFRIEPGPPVRIRHLDITLTGAGRKDPAFGRLLQDLPLHRGARLIQPDYERAKDLLAQLAAVRGYLDAHFTRHEIRIDLPQNAADVILSFDTGPRYRFGPVTFRQDVLDPSFLRRYLPFHRGEFYSTALLQSLQTALSDSDYFETVEVEPQRRAAGAHHEVPIVVYLKARRPSKYTFGIGYGTDTGARASVGWARRRIGRRGHHADVELKVSQIGNSLTARYIIPLARPLTDQFIASTGIFNQRTDTNVIHLQNTSATVQRVRGLLQESIYLNFQHEQYRVGDQSGDSFLLMPGIAWQYGKQRGAYYSLRGYRLNLDVHGSARNVGSDTTFIQSLLRARVVYPLLRGGRVLLRGDLGLSWVPQFSTLPASQRFFAGGAQSVRGYGYQTLGPTDASGQVIGGRYLIVGSVEYEHRVWRRWGVAAFYDVGNALNRLNGGLDHGAGVGLRWHSPVGPIRIDFAWALDLPGTPMRVQFSMGPDL